VGVRSESIAFPRLRDRPVAEPGAIPAEPVPRRATGLEFLGEFARSGHRRPPSLIKRTDGQIVQLTPLLYEILRHIDGRRRYSEIAEAVGARIGKLVTADDIRGLTESKLRPLGLLDDADSATRLTKANPILALRLRLVLTNERITNGIASLFSWLFLPPFVIAFTIAFVTTIAWLLFDRGLAGAARHALYEPGLLLLIFALTTLSAGFHELGHAAACRYSGAKPGAMGVGLYLVWPAFYTDVSDAYRLSRGGRLRVDLGGLYFNAIFAVAALAAWMATRWEALLVVIALQGLQMLRQLIPLVRLDGYHILADLTGVPDLFAHIGPILRGLIPTRARRARAGALKPWVRFTVTAWVLAVVPLLATILVLLVITLPRLGATAWDSLGLRWTALAQDLERTRLTEAGTELLAIAALAIPVLSMVYLLARVVARITRKTWRKTDGKPVHRAVAVIVAAGLIAGLVTVWWPHGQYRPIRDNETGRLFAVPDGPWQVDDLARHVNETWALSAFAVEDAGGTSSRTLDRDSFLSEAVPPIPGTPVDLEGAQDPAFGFPLPAAPGEGDNQALAVNLKDGATLVEIALSLILSSDELVDNSNEAYALASCTRCATVAIAFQVIVIQGQPPTIVPGNVAAAINAECTVCLTYAEATQLVTHLVEPLSDEQVGELRATFKKLRRLKSKARKLGLNVIKARLDRLKAKVASVLGVGEDAMDEDVDATTQMDEHDPAASSSPSASPTTTENPSPSPSASPSESPSPSPSQEPSPSP
jgi:putative peptide zinc metalloprotease protein